MINKKYLDFMKELNKNKINWCLIKDHEYLMKHGYDNEIDLITEEKNRNRIRNLAKKLKLYESALNSTNTHLIFWKFEGLKPFRIDIHIDKALATAVPWFKAKDILKDKIKKGDLWIASAKWELGILLLSSFRGRKPKQWRIKRAKELISNLNETKQLLRAHLTDNEIEKYCSYLIKGKIIRFSKLKRLGIFGSIKHLFLLPRLLVCRIASPAKVVVLSNKNSKELFNVLSKSKINVKITKNPFSRYVSDVILKTNKRKEDVDIKEIIENLG